MSEGRLLGCDFGGRRTGISVSDPSATIAFPVTTVESQTPREAARKVAALAVEHEAVEVVVGMPLTLRGERGEQALKTDEFVDKLREEFSGAVHTWDERLTSVQGERILQEMGGKASRGRVDPIAATLMLQSYLDFRAARRAREALSQEDPE